MRFSGHESFVCRYAWLPKAYRALAENPAMFGDVEQAMVSLGVGKNMVRSIRFWVEVMGVAIPQRDRTLVPSTFGESVFDDDGFDPYLEDVRTLVVAALECRITDRGSVVRMGLSPAQVAIR